MTKNQPLVSVIIPVYNRQHLIGTALESVLSQTYRNYEIIVIDDASLDNTSDWTAEHYPQAKIIKVAQNIGAAGARNIGIEEAKGKFVAFLDSDDYWDSTYLEVLVQALEDNPYASFAFANHREILQSNIIKQVAYQVSTQYRDLVHRSLVDIFIYTMSVVVVRKDTLLACGSLNSRLSISHDRELYIRLLQEGEMVHVAECLVTRIMHSQNISTNYHDWANNVFLLLDIFFKNKNNKEYLPLESTIRSRWAVVIAKHLWKVEKSPFSSAKTACKVSPRFVFDKFKNKLVLYTQDRKNTVIPPNLRSHSRS